MLLLVLILPTLLYCNMVASFNVFSLVFRVPERVLLKLDKLIHITFNLLNHGPLKIVRII